MVNALRARVDEEYRIMERLDTKARQAFAFVAAFFAVVQAVAFGTFAEGGITPTERVILAVFAVTAGLSVLVVGHHLRNQEDLQTESDIKPEEILKWWNEASSENDVSVHLASGLAEVAKERHANNLRRSTLFNKLDSWARWSLILTSLELLVAIVIRV